MSADENDIRYTIVCLNGHTWQERANTALGQRATTRAAKGFLDAIPVPCSECATCTDEADRQDRLNHEFCEDPEDRQLREDWDDIARKRDYLDHEDDTDAREQYHHDIAGTEE